MQISKWPFINGDMSTEWEPDTTFKMLLQICYFSYWFIYIDYSSGSVPSNDIDGLLLDGSIYITSALEILNV